MSDSAVGEEVSMGVIKKFLRLSRKCRGTHTRTHFPRCPDYLEAVWDTYTLTHGSVRMLRKHAKFRAQEMTRVMGIFMACKAQRTLYTNAFQLPCQKLEGVNST